jgi:hypothetical protein
MSLSICEFRLSDCDKFGGGLLVPDTGRWCAGVLIVAAKKFLCKRPRKPRLRQMNKLLASIKITKKRSLLLILAASCAFAADPPPTGAKVLDSAVAGHRVLEQCYQI